MTSSIRKTCLNCLEPFNAQIKEIKRGNGKFCCFKCFAEYNGKNRPKPVPNVICAYCNKPFHMSESKKKLSKSGLYFCCRAHKDEAQCIGGIRAIMPPHYGTTVQDYRTIMFKTANKPKICERCKYDSHEAAIIVHHKNRDRSDNSIDNLEILCANCHAIEHWAN